MHDFHRLEHAERSLRSIKAFADAHFEGNNEITKGKNDFDLDKHVYDLNCIMGAIRSSAYEGLWLEVPLSKKIKTKGENYYGNK